MSGQSSISHLDPASSSPLLRTGDLFGIVDIADPSQSASGSTVKVTLADFFAALPTPIVLTNASGNPALVLQVGGTAPSGAFFGNYTGVMAHVSGDAIWHALSGGGSGGTAKFIAASSGGTLLAPTATLSGNVLGMFGATGYGTGWVTSVRGWLQIIADDDWSGTSHPTKFEFQTTGVGSIVPRVVGSIGSDGVFGFNFGLVVTVPANAKAVDVLGWSLTGASTVSLATFAGTANTSGIYTALSLAITNTASGAGSLLLDLLAGAGGVTSMFSVGVTGIVNVRKYLQFQTGEVTGTSGSVFKNPTYGLTLYGVTGSMYDAALLDNGGNPIVAVAGTSKLAFFGVTAVTRPVLATGTGKTVDNVITALQTLGLVSQT